MSGSTKSMNRTDSRAATHLSRLGVNPAVIARLVAYAQEDGMTLAEMVRYVLSDYHPPVDPREPTTPPIPISPDQWK